MGDIILWLGEICQESKEKEESKKGFYPCIDSKRKKL